MNPSYSSLKDAAKQYNSLNDVIIREEINTTDIENIHRFKIYKIKMLNGLHNLISHEVIIGSHPLKIFFDIDIENVINFNKALFINEFKRAITYTWNKLYMAITFYEITDDDFVFYSSHGNEKISYHVVVLGNKYMMPNMTTMLKFYQVFIETIDKDYVNYFDKVYISVKSLRMLNSVKNGRIKILDPEFNSPYVLENHIWKDSLIKYSTNPNVSILPTLDNVLLTIEKPLDDIYTYNLVIDNKELSVNIKSKFTNISDDKDVATFFKKYDGDILLAGMQYRETLVATNIKKIITFNRISPSFCQLCEKVHESENNLYIYINKTYNELNSINETRFTACCRRNPKNSKVLFIMGDSKNINGEIVISEKGKFNLDSIIPHPIPVDGTKSEFIRYNDSNIREFQKCRTLFIDEPMKMGKTKQLLQFVKNNYDLNNVRIIILTFRQTFAYSMYEKFSELGFTLYSDLQGTLNCDKLIIQLESLHRVDIKDTDNKINLLVLDESESIMEQINSGLFKSFGQAFAIFQYLIKYSEMVICMDAYMSQRSYNIIDKIRGLNNSIYQYNDFKREQNTKMNIYTEYNDWLYKMVTYLRDNKKIALMANSKIEAKAIKEFLQKEFPNKVVFLYTQDEPSPQVKLLHFKDINNYWNKYDVLITTPTVSAGISFEVAHYDYVFGYFSYMSCGAETAMQMLGRVRIIKENELNIFIKYEITYSYPTNTDVIYQLVINRHNTLTANIDMSFINFEFNEKGKMTIYNTDYFCLWLENIRIMHLNKSNYFINFIKLAKKTGFIIDVINDTQNNGLLVENTDIGDFVKAKKIEIIDREANNVANAEDITFETYVDLTDKIDKSKKCTDDELIKQFIVTNDEKYSIEKFQFVKKFSIDETETHKINKQIIKIYDNHDMFVKFRNLNTISICYDKSNPNYIDVDKYLRMLKDNENINYALNKSSLDIMILNYKPNIDIMILINEFLKLYGFESLFDFNACISARDLHRITSEKHNDVIKIYNKINSLNLIRKKLNIDHSEFESLLQIRNIRNTLSYLLDKYLNMSFIGNNEKKINKSYFIRNIKDFTYRNGKFHIILL